MIGNDSMQSCTKKDRVTEREKWLMGFSHLVCCQEVSVFHQPELLTIFSSVPNPSERPAVCRGAAYKGKTELEHPS